MGSCVNHFNVSLTVWAKSQDSVHNLKIKESRSGSNRGPSAYQLSALPLGHTVGRIGARSTVYVSVPRSISGRTDESAFARNWGKARKLHVPVAGQCPCSGRRLTAGPACFPPVSSIRTTSAWCHGLLLRQLKKTVMQVLPSPCSSRTTPPCVVDGGWCQRLHGARCGHGSTAVSAFRSCIRLTPYTSSSAVDWSGPIWFALRNCLIAF